MDQSRGVAGIFVEEAVAPERPILVRKTPVSSSRYSEVIFGLAPISLERPALVSSLLYTQHSALRIEAHVATEHCVGLPSWGTRRLRCYRLHCSQLAK